MEYDFLAFADRGQPISVRTIRQVHHDTETDVPLPQRDETITTVEYSDGFGRLLQPGPRPRTSFSERTPLRQRGPAVAQIEPGGDAVGHPIPIL